MNPLPCCLQIFGDGTAGIRVDCPSDIIFFLEGAASAAISAREGKVADGPAGGGPRSQEGLDAEACTDPEVLRQRGNELYRCGLLEGHQVCAASRVVCLGCALLDQFGGCWSM